MDRQMLKHKIAVVTGGTSGIGKEIAIKFAKEGATVIIAGRNANKWEAVDNGHSHLIHFIQADVSQPDEAKKLIDYAYSISGRLDVLVNNAGVQYEKTIEETSPEEWDMVLSINLKSVFLCSKNAIPYMRIGGGGSIINISSVDGFWAEPMLGAYCASKAGIIGLTKSVALDFGRDSIRCNSICPGYIETDMLTEYFNVQYDPQASRSKITDEHPLRRLGSPNDVANMALWLASDDSSFATGQTYVIDGGLTSGHGSML
ncbi:SDR family oxidoreductase [Neobacillus niacini]|uniref:SDR family NAD(P)-dependent oxidoreductase n=1 Tax=Neobacillus niacini TaxID=86668 RepID=UPI0030032674